MNEFMNMNRKVNRCRTCQHVIKSKSQNLFGQAEGILLDQIEALTGIYLLSASNLSTDICERCEVSLRLALTFREQIIEVQNELQGCYPSTKVFKTINNDYIYEKNDTSICRENLDYELNSNQSHQELINDSSTEDNDELNCNAYMSDNNLVKIESSEDDNTLIKDEIQIPIDSLTSDEGEDEDEAWINRDEAVPQFHSEVVKSEISKKSVQYLKMDSEDKQRTNWKKLSPEETTTVKRERRQGDYICDQCGRLFNCPSNLKIHILRHTGIKDFKCPICPSKFYTQSLLTRHEKFHREGNPYVCRHCPKSFKNTVNRLRHERNNHTHYKPFKCEECGKSFPVIGNLNMHMITHTRNRLFPCEICGISFMTKRHLRNHNNCKTHKLNAERAQAATDTCSNEFQNIHD